MYELDVENGLFSARVTVMFIFSSAAVMLLAVFDSMIEAQGAGWLILFIVCQIACSSVIIFGWTTLIRETQLRTENIVLKKLFSEDMALYEKLKDNVELLNIMCHDLKHGFIGPESAGVGCGCAFRSSSLRPGGHARQPGKPAQGLPARATVGDFSGGGAMGPVRFC